MRSTVLLLFLLPGYFAGAQMTSDSLATQNATPPAVKAPKKNNKVLLHTGIALGYAGAAYLVYQKEDAHFKDESQEMKNPFMSRMATSVSPLGVGKNAWMALGATAGLAYLTKNTRLQHTAFVWAGSLLVNGMATDKLKNTFQRYRPNTGMPFNTFDGYGGPHINHSLPSAHTSNAFTTATVFATMYKDKKWVPPVAYGVATLVGLSRIYNNAHWASDVMAGAAVGFLSAKTMLLTDKWLSQKGIRLYPQVGRHGAGLGMVKTF